MPTVNRHTFLTELFRQPMTSKLIAYAAPPGATFKLGNWPSTYLNGDFIMGSMLPFFKVYCVGLSRHVRTTGAIEGGYIDACKKNGTLAHMWGVFNQQVTGYSPGGIPGGRAHKWRGVFILQLLPQGCDATAFPLTPSPAWLGVWNQKVITDYFAIEGAEEVSEPEEVSEDSESEAEEVSEAEESEAEEGTV